jgi:hypothetical protein
MNNVAPAFVAAIAFCFAPPISPTAPLASIVPVTATTWWPVSDPALNWSTIVIVMASPAKGPPILGVLIDKLTG